LELKRLMMKKTTVGVTQGGVMRNSDWSGVVGDSDWVSCVSGDWVNSFGDNWSNSFDDSWGRSIDDSIESVDIIGGVGDSSDSTIGFDNRVLALDDISVTGLAGSLGISGQGVGNGVSVVVLWVGVIWLWLDGNGFCDWDYGFGHWVSISKGCGVRDDWGGISSMSICWSSISWSCDHSSGGDSGEGKDGDGLNHFDFVWNTPKISLKFV